MKMKEAGCDHIEFGVESGDLKMLERMKKNITLAQAEKAISCARKLGVPYRGCIYSGSSL